MKKKKKKMRGKILIFRFLLLWPNVQRMTSFLADIFPDSIYLICFVPTIPSSSDRSRDKSFGFFTSFFFLLLPFYCSERIFISLECCVPCRAVCVSMENAAPSRHKANGNHFEISKIHLKRT